MVWLLNLSKMDCIIDLFVKVASFFQIDFSSSQLYPLVPFIILCFNSAQNEL